MFSLGHFAQLLQLLQFHRVLLTSIRCAGRIVLMNAFYWTRRTAGPIVKSVERNCDDISGITITDYLSEGLAGHMIDHLTDLVVPTWA
jgi:hypothetical protein